jgi:hypothetical protein
VPQEDPAEFYPFLASPRNTKVIIDKLINSQDVKVLIPEYHTWQAQAPPPLQRNQPVPFAESCAEPQINSMTMVLPWELGSFSTTNKSAQIAGHAADKSTAEETVSL